MDGLLRQWLRAGKKPAKISPVASSAPGPAAHSYSRSARALRPMMCFSDVLLDKPLSREAPGVAWPQYERQFAARHLRRGIPACHAPQINPDQVEDEIPEAVFLGALDPHFGHFTAETAPRLLQSMLCKPELPYLLTAHRQILGSDIPPAMRAVLDWYGIPRKKLRIVWRPTRVKKLWVAGQPEDLNGPVVSEEYLDLLDQHCRSRGLNKSDQSPSGVLYVSRHKLHARLGGHAGEAYLAETLEKAGVQVLIPENEPLPKQLALYAGAERVIFAEGSAIHGRQLIGRVRQSIDVLVRRRVWRMAESQLSARCDLLGYIPVVGNSLAFLGRDGKAYTHSALALYDLPVLFDYFAQIGIDLAAHWNQDDYLAARDRHVLAWIEDIYMPDRRPWERPWNGPDRFVKILTEAGLPHLVSGALALIEKSAWKGTV